jgi:hypothetical protein
MKKTEEKTIDGATYAVTQFSATKSLKTFHRLGRMIGPAFGALTGGAALGDVANANITAESFGTAIKALFESCDEATFERTVKDLLETTTKDGKPINFDLDFSGSIGTLFKVLAFVLEVNYSDFLGAIVALRK